MSRDAHTVYLCKQNIQGLLAVAGVTSLSKLVPVATDKVLINQTMHSVALEFWGYHLDFGNKSRGIPEDNLGHTAFPFPERDCIRLVD